jgi:hypothetical protein
MANPKTSQGYVHECRKIHIQELYRRGIIVPNIAKTATYTVPSFRDQTQPLIITVDSDLTSSDGTLTIAGQTWKLSTRNHPYSGGLEWLVADLDGRRYSYLYLTPNHKIGTRKSLHLVYRSQHLKEAERAAATYKKRTYKARRRIRPNLDPVTIEAENIGSKRPGLWQRTQDRYVAQIEALKAKAAAIVNGTWQRVGKKARKARTKVTAPVQGIVAQLGPIADALKPEPGPEACLFGGVEKLVTGQIIAFHDPQPTPILEQHRQHLIDVFSEEEPRALELVPVAEYWRIKEITEQRRRAGLMTDLRELRFWLWEQRTFGGRI